MVTEQDVWISIGLIVAFLAVLLLFHEVMERGYRDARDREARDRSQGSTHPAE